MRAVVDTNLVAYYLLATEPYIDEARRFWRAAGETIAPALWEAELTNVLWMAIRTGVLTPKGGQERLGLAARLRVRSVGHRKLWRGALVRAVDSGVAVYDTLFVELAVRERVPLATFDGGLHVAFPEIAIRPGALFE